MKKPNPELPLPEGRVAMVVTKAPSEPWELIKETLLAMMSQDYPNEYHVWLADEAPSQETWDWCMTNGVGVTTRFGNKQYHQPKFPARTKTKEGNLRYFYDTVGYENYDFVVQLDADHKPETDYLRHMIQPFINPKVGYVAAPSICDANSNASWTVRARLYAEAALHGCLQAGYNNPGWNPMCIGSHYAVRVEALRELVHPVKSTDGYVFVKGGLASELAEDHNTTLAMVTNGWIGAFAFDAIAHGDGAESINDSITQELQWSRSLTAILFGWTKGYFALGNISGIAKFQFAFSQLWYPLFGFHMLVALLLPAIALVGNFSWVRINYIEFSLRFGLIVATCLLPLIYLKRLGTFRPANAKVVSWEMYLFQLIRWPWALLGVIQGMISAITHKEMAFKVTEKGKIGSKSISLITLLPYILIVLLSGAVSIATNTGASSRGYYYLILMSGLSYALVIGCIIALHIKENPNMKKLTLVKPSAFGVIAAIVLTVALFFRAPIAVRAIVSQLQLAAPATINLENGVSYGAYDPENLLQNGIQIRQIFQIWKMDDSTGLANQLVELNGTALITLEPYAWNWNGLTDDTLLVDIAEGKYDSTIITHCQTISDYNPNAIIRWGHEMDIERKGQPWSNKDPQKFVGAFQHFVDLCRQYAPSAKIMWSPAGSSQMVNYWPGDGYVDVVGVTTLSYFQWNNFHFGETAPVSFAKLFGERYDLVKRFNKPIVIAEFGICCGDQLEKDWLNEAYTHIGDFPLLRGIVYFNANQTDGGWGPEVPAPDWRIDNSLFPPSK